MGRGACVVQYSAWNWCPGIIEATGVKGVERPDLGDRSV
jgi:hypothetical protein